MYNPIYFVPGLIRLTMELLTRVKEKVLPKNEHRVAAVGTGYICLDTGACHYVTLAEMVSGEKQQAVFDAWDRDHGVKHRVATQVEIDGFGR